MEVTHTGASNKATIMIQMTVVALIAGALFWIIESYAEVYLTHHHGDMHDWLIPHDTSTLLHRILVVILCLSFGAINGFAAIKRRRLEMQLKELTELDSLTRIYNRRMCMTYLEQEIHRSRRYKERIGKKDPAVIMFDIDHFKKVNNKYGQDIGDNVLTTLSDVVKNNIRNADILARFGGAEFMIIAPETNIAGAKILAEKIRHIVEQYKFDEVNRVTISIGVSAYRNEDNLDRLVKRANMALYEAKRGGNRIEVSD